MSLKSRINDKIQADSDKMNEWLDDPNVSGAAKAAYRVADELGQTAYEALESTLPVLKRTGIKTYEPVKISDDAQDQLLKNASKAVIKMIDNVDKLPQLGDKTKYQIKKAAKTIVNFALDNDDEIIKASKILTALPKDVAITLIHLPQLPKSYANKLLRTFIKREGVKLTNTMYKSSPKSKSKNISNITKRGRNDLSWYSHYNELMGVANGLQFQMPEGTLIGDRSRFWYKGPNGNWGSTQRFTVSDVAAIRVHLTNGSVPALPYLNRLYATIRRTNSGAINYKTLDLHKYLVNYRTVLLMYAVGKRAYGTLKAVSRYNVNRPQILFGAMGLDYDTFSENAANLRNMLNQVANRISIYAPYNLDIFKRTEWLFSNIYMTSNAAKDQCVILAPDYAQEYWNYTAPNGETFGSFVAGAPPQTGTTGLTYANYITELMKVVNNMCASKDNINAIISGDMMKAFGVGGIRKVDEIPENYTVTPVYNEEVLDQISNASIVPTTYTVPLTRLLAVSSDGNCLEEAVSYAVDPDVALANAEFPVYLNTDKDNISPDYILSMSRFSATYDVANGNVTSWGTEIVTGMRYMIAFPAGNSAYKLDFFAVTGANTFDLSAPGTVMDVCEVLRSIENFDYSPKVKFYFKNFNVGPNGSTCVTGLDANNRVTGNWTAEMIVSPYIYDWANWAPVTHDELMSLHNAAVQSLYYIPLNVKPVNSLVKVD